MKKRGSMIIWVDYFDSSIGRRQGRRVPLSIATHAPRLEEVVKAAEAIGLKVEEVVVASHPKRHRSRTGYVRVSKVPNEGKMAALHELAKALTRLRSLKGQAVGKPKERRLHS